MLLFPYIISQLSGSKWEAESMQEALLLSFQVYPSFFYCFFSFTNLPQHGAESCPVHEKEAAGFSFLLAQLFV